MSEEITAVSIAHGLEGIYLNFTDEIKNLGGKYGGKGKFGNSVLHWITGSHVKTQRDILCEKFLSDVQGQLQLLDASFEGCDEQEVHDACAVVADILSEPVSPKSNGTSDLMKRAMISQLTPFLKGLTREKLEWTKSRIEAAYSKSQRLPVERDILKEINRLLQN